MNSCSSLPRITRSQSQKFERTEVASAASLPRSASFTGDTLLLDVKPDDIQQHWSKFSAGPSQAVLEMVAGRPLGIAPPGERPSWAVTRRVTVAERDREMTLPVLQASLEEVKEHVLGLTGQSLPATGIGLETPAHRRRLWRTSAGNASLRSYVENYFGGLTCLAEYNIETRQIALLAANWDADWTPSQLRETLFHECVHAVQHARHPEFFATFLQAAKARFRNPCLATVAAFYPLSALIEGHAEALSVRSSRWYGYDGLAGPVPKLDRLRQGWRKLRLKAAPRPQYHPAGQAYEVGKIVIRLIQNDGWVTTGISDHAPYSVNPPHQPANDSEVLAAEGRLRVSDAGWPDRRRQFSHDGVRWLFRHPVLAHVLFSATPPTEVTLDVTAREARRIEDFIAVFAHLNPRLRGPVRVRGGRKAPQAD